VITPSALNVLIIGASVIIFGFFWRMLAARLSAGSSGQAMSTVY
jgi:hypothetical protein